MKNNLAEFYKMITLAFSVYLISVKLIARPVESLSHTVAHDFNNIMIVVLGNITLAEIYLDTSNQEKMQKSLKAIKESAERATKLTKQLLIFSRKDLIKPKLVDICALLYYQGSW